MTLLASPAQVPVAPFKSTRRGRLILPLSALLAASAIAVGSGADFVSTSVNTTNAFTAGTLTQTNSKANAAIFNISNMKPGDTVNGTVTITNSGTLPSTFKLTEAATNNFATASVLQLTITQNGVQAPVWSGTLGNLTAAGPISLGQFAAGEARTYTFSVNLIQAATNAEQGKTATATYTWDAIQTAATTTNQ